MRMRGATEIAGLDNDMKHAQLIAFYMAVFALKLCRKYVTACGFNQSINHVYFRQSPYEIKKESKKKYNKKYLHKNIYTVKPSCTQQQNYTPVVYKKAVLSQR